MMIRNRLFPSALALSFLIGCAGEEATTPDAASPSPSASDAAKSPAVPPAPPIKAENKAPELTPAPAAADEAKTPALTPAPAPTPAAEEAKDKAAPAGEAKKAETKPSLEGPSADAAKLTEEEIAEIKKLPADEQAAALAQAVCPSSDEHLGAMGVPIKVSAEGRTFYICCKGCQKDVKNDAKALIAKLDALSKK